MQLLGSFQCLEHLLRLSGRKTVVAQLLKVLALAFDASGTIVDMPLHCCKFAVLAIGDWLPVHAT